MGNRLWLLALCLLALPGLRFGSGADAGETTAAREPGEEGLGDFIRWLLKDGGDRLEDIRFAKVVEAVSGRRMLPVDTRKEPDAALMDAVADALNAAMKDFERATNPIHEVGRVNEISRHIEDELRRRLDTMEGFRCGIPRTEAGDRQLSGYPDLRLEHEASGRVFYLDPKAYKDGTEDSSFRTFYFEPKGETNKILDDASHLIVGIAHGGKTDGRWRLKRWTLVDLIDFRVSLKAEFQAGNRDLYRPDAVIRRGTGSSR